MMMKSTRIGRVQSHLHPLSPELLEPSVRGAMTLVETLLDIPTQHDVTPGLLRLEQIDDATRIAQREFPVFALLRWGRLVLLLVAPAPPVGDLDDPPPVDRYAVARVRQALEAVPCLPQCCVVHERSAVAREHGQFVGDFVLRKLTRRVGRAHVDVEIRGEGLCVHELRVVRWHARDVQDEWVERAHRFGGLHHVQSQREPGLKDVRGRFARWRGRADQVGDVALLERGLHPGGRVRIGSGAWSWTDNNPGRGCPNS